MSKTIQDFDKLINFAKLLRCKIKLIEHILIINFINCSNKNIDYLFDYIYNRKFVMLENDNKSITIDLESINYNQLNKEKTLNHKFSERMITNVLRNSAKARNWNQNNDYLLFE